MQSIENSKIKEKIVVEKLANGLTVIIVPKHTTQKKYAIWGVNFGSIDNTFVVPTSGNTVQIPDGVAHFLEHKMFEQESGVNSLDTLSALGVDANAYTTNDHTAYLFECTDKFYEALDELMDYVQHPYFTDENVEKEKGIIGQEIMMYDDYPGWVVYLNAMDCLYHNNPVKLNITGTVETIASITKETLYDCYHTFYHPSNMVLTIAGDFEPEAILGEVKKRLLDKPAQGEIKRIYPEEPVSIHKEYAEQTMEISNPLFAIGYKDTLPKEDIVKKHIAIEILLNMIIGKSSDLYQKLYEQGILLTEPDLDYEFSREYAHILITGQSKDPKKVYEGIQKTVIEYQQKGIDEEHFERVKRLIYGEYIKEYNDITNISKMFLADYFKGINSFEYIEECNLISKAYVEQIVKEVLKQDNRIISIVKGKEK